jgi:hypothetical protein
MARLLDETPNWLSVSNSTRSPAEDTPRSPRTKVWQFQIIKTLSKPFRAALRFWRISSFAKKSRISITSEFPSVSEHLHVRETMVGHLRHIEEDLGKRVAAGLAFDKIPVAPPAAAPVQEMKLSPAIENSECWTRCRRRGCQRQSRFYCRGKDPPMGPGKVGANIGLTAVSVKLRRRSIPVK